MNILSSILIWIGNTIGANPNTLTTTSKTLVGAINEVDGDITTVSGDVSTIQTDLQKAIFIDEIGTDSAGWNYIKYSDGRLEATRIWSVGQVTLNNTVTSSWKESANFNVVAPTMMTSGYIEVGILGDSSNSPIVMQRVSSSVIRVGKATTQDVTLQGVQFTERLINARWKETEE